MSVKTFALRTLAHTQRTPMGKLDIDISQSLCVRYLIISIHKANVALHGPLFDKENGSLMANDREGLGTGRILIK